jgi:hypothetical protein
LVVQSVKLSITGSKWIELGDAVLHRLSIIRAKHTSAWIRGFLAGRDRRGTEGRRRLHVPLLVQRRLKDEEYPLVGFASVMIRELLKAPFTERQSEEQQ